MLDLHRCARNIEAVLSEEDVSMKSMDYDKIHMTIVFLGSAMKGMQKEVRKSVIRLIDTFHCADAVLTLDHYELFGREKNLLVACFTGPPEFVECVIRHKSLYERYGAKKEDFFTPHITLGKIHSTTNHEVDLALLSIPLISIPVERLVLA